jgi:hypothetical protein
VRRDRLIQEHEHDPYKSRKQLHDPTVCPDCAAVFREGRWRWAEGPADAPRSTCPACQRVRDRHPGGIVTLGGDFLAGHRDEVLGLARNVESREKADHPLQRIMDVEEGEGRIVVTTTDMHLARSIGDALHHAYQGELDYHYVEEQAHLRVSWSRSG